MSRPTATYADLGAIVVCTLAWGSTWYAITHQLGVVDPVVSVVWRFLLAAALLFAWCLLRREPLWLTRSQNLEALGLGISTFAINYVFVYWAEARVSSAVVAVLFASLTFVNLVLFRVVFGDRARVGAWIAAVLGICGIAILSWGEISGSSFDASTWYGIALVFVGVAGSAIGNVYARRGQAIGAPIAASTAWAMVYGVAALVIVGLVRGVEWRIDLRAPYMLSLLYLSVIGSVVTFVLYYGLARRRGYAVASYISALTPPLAMLISTLFEGKHWGPFAFGGVAFVLAGQWLLLRSRKDPN
ncbi:MAG: EamA family transporter [Alphaproteobacteria bacterium]|nr:EamA family transporter [Alphaproteobacteria bacterium]